MGGANTFSGNTFVSSGTLVVGTPLALQNSPLDPSGTGTFSFGPQTAATLGGLTNTGTVNLVNVTPHSVALTLNAGGTVIFNGQVTGPGSVTMNGAGMQVLAGVNNYSGGSNVNGGTLQFKGATGTALQSGSSINLGGGVVSIANDGSGSGGTINVGNNITLTSAVSTTPTMGIDVRGATGSTSSNTVAFGVLSNGTTANALSSTINFTAANSYRQSFTGLNLPGATGYTTLLNPTTTTVTVLGNVNNQMHPTATGQYDTLDLDGTTTGNTIYGPISDSPLFGGVNDGDTRITKSNSSLWILAGTGNSFSGPTTITGGTLQLGSGLSGQDGTLGNSSSVSNSASLVFNYLGSVTGTYSISGTGSLSMIGPGGITLGASNSYTGPTNVSNGTLALGSNGAVAQSSTISLSTGTTLDVSQVSGGFQLGTGQVLTGTGNYTVNGGMTIVGSSTLLPGGVASAGTLNVGGLTLSPSSTLKFDLGAGQDLINVGTSNGGLTINGGGIGLYQANGTTAFTAPGTYLLMNCGNGNSIGGLASNLSVLNPSATNVYTFTATGGSLDVTISPPDIWNGGGGPSFNWSNGSNWTSGLAPSSGTSVMFAGTTGTSNTNNISSLSLSGIFFSPTAGAFNISGNSIQLGGPILNLSTSAQTIGMNILLSAGPNGNGQNVVASAGSIVLNGIIDDGGQGYGINVSGSGGVVLGGANTYSGTTNVAGPLRLANPLAVQNSTLNLLPSGGSVTFAAGTTAGAIAALAGSGTGGITLTTSTGQPVTLTVGSTGLSSTFAGTIKGSGSLVEQGNGTFTLSGSETYTGATVVSGGVLQLLGSVQSGAGNTISGFGGNGTGWTLNSSNGTPATVVSNVLTLTFGGSNSARSAFLNQPEPLAAFNASFVYQGTLNGADGVAMVWQNSSSGAHARGSTGGGLGYGGITPSAAVEINIYNGHTIGTNYATGGATGTYLDSSPVNPASGDPIAVTVTYDGVSMLTETMLDTTTNQTYTTSYPIGDLATTVGGESAYIGFTGGDGGVTSTQKISNFSYSLISILPTSTALSVSNGATVDLSGIYQTVASLSSTDGQGSQVLLGNGALTIANTAGTSTTFDGVITGGSGATPSLTVQGGMLTLTGQNTFTGVTSITGGGTLQLAAGAIADGSISSSAVSDNGTLLYKFNDNQAIGYRITGLGSMRTAGGGVMTLTATNTYLGATAINGGTLQLGDGQSGDDGALYVNVISTSGVVNNGALVFDLAGSQTASYRISGSGSLAMIGSGMLTLSGSNTYNGGTFVESGVLVVTNRAAIADGSSLTVGDASVFPAPVIPAAEINGEQSAASPPVAPVPEPGALALLTAAICGAAVARWIRREKRHAG